MNVILIALDTLRADHLGCYGNPILKTPHVDMLAARGIAFDRFYAATPICMPNRATLMTGRMPSVHGVRHNGIPLSLRATTFVELMRAAGYRTAMVGKSHLQNMLDRPPLVLPPLERSHRLGKLLAAVVLGLALLLLVAILAFYAGSLAEFQFGAFAPDWAKALLLYTPPKSNVDYRTLDDVFTSIQQHYVKPNASGVKLTEGAAAGMVNALGDQFSRYLTPDEYKANQTFLSGQFAGIGASVQQKTDQIVIVSVMPATPAEKAGVKPGDVITGVDGQSTKGWTADDAVNRYRTRVRNDIALAHVFLVHDRLLSRADLRERLQRINGNANDQSVARQ